MRSSQLQEYVALQKWEFRGYDDSRIIVEKHQRQLHRLARRVNDILKAPAGPVLTVTLEKSGFDDMQVRPSGHPRKVAEGASVEEVDPTPSHGGGLLEQALAKRSAALETHFGDLITTLAERTAQLRLDTARGHVSRKRLALKDLFDAIAEIGISKSEIAVPVHSRGVFCSFTAVRIYQEIISFRSWV